ncbi:MAG: hypothetical protein NZ585_04895 [Chloracidobacterium sp.]|nr:hypothetical protein [Chloracidobacterium sp.]MDW8216821.1 hypothetical protein [Acidobacteriota bacterium]
MVSRRTFLSTLWLAAVAGMSAAAVHKFHASFTTIEYNANSGSLEVLLRVFSDDLESALSRKARRRIELDRTPNIAELVGDYVRERFKLRRMTGDALRLLWVGMEQRVDMTWIYVEAPAPAGLTDVEALVTIFFELFRDQKNNVSSKDHRGKRHDILFRPGENIFKPLIPLS